jgi:hypothetical protein
MMATIMVTTIKVVIIKNATIVIWPATLCNSERHNSPVPQRYKPQVGKP